MVLLSLVELSRVIGAQMVVVSPPQTSGVLPPPPLEVKVVVTKFEVKPAGPVI